MKLMSLLSIASMASAAAGERVLTATPSGHMMNHRQCFSPDGRYIYFDSRNDETLLAESAAIGRVNVESGEEEIVYRIPGNAKYGPGCGAVTCSPASGRLAFIHGLANASPELPYAVFRRFGGSVSPLGKLVHLDARDISAPYTPGSLRGGTHAHHWSPDGSRISFTYNDALVSAGAEQLRTVGVMQVENPVDVIDPAADDEFSGTCFTVTIAKVTLAPKPGSDEMFRAFDEGWIDNKRIAFQANLLTLDGRTITEIFLATLPDDLTHVTMPAGPADYPDPPAGIVIKRLTHTDRDPDPGVNGPRQWLQPQPGGGTIAFLDTDANGIVQIHTLPVAGGTAEVLTHFKQSVGATYSWSPDGKRLACESGGRIYLVDVATGDARALTEPCEDDRRPRFSVVFSPDGKTVAYNRMLPAGNDGTRWVQICLASVAPEE